MALATEPQPPVYDLAVCYRIYPGLSREPAFGFTSKDALARAGIRTMADACGGLRVKFFILLDNCPPHYRDMFTELLDGHALEMSDLQGEGNEATFARQIDVLSQQTAADLVYFAEDDYLYVPGALETAVAFINDQTDIDFLTLYDHADFSRLQIHLRHRSEDRRWGDRHWRTVRSSCLTFMTRRSTLIENADVLRSYSRGNSDLGVWLALTRKGMFTPVSYINGLFDSRFCFGSHLLAWRHGFRQLLAGPTRKLWAPTPSLCTHLESTGIAPGYNWQDLLVSAKKRSDET